MFLTSSSLQYTNPDGEQRKGKLITLADVYRVVDNSLKFAICFSCYSVKKVPLTLTYRPSSGSIPKLEEWEELNLVM